MLPLLFSFMLHVAVESGTILYVESGSILYVALCTPEWLTIA